MNCEVEDVVVDQCGVGGLMNWLMAPMLHIFALACLIDGKRDYMISSMDAPTTCLMLHSLIHSTYSH